MRALFTRGLVGVALVTAVLVGAAPAQAQSATGQNFGSHVATCAHEMGGFDGTHNPGMHRGFAGWDGAICEP